MPFLQVEFFNNLQHSPLISPARLQVYVAYSPGIVLLTEYTIAVGGNVGIGTLMVRISGFGCCEPPAESLRLLLTYNLTFCCKSEGSWKMEV
jgi:hypothetical protein